MLNLSLSHEQLLSQLTDISRQAGQAILEVYSRDFSIESKADASPLTEADLASHHTIVNALQTLTPDIPILSEESSDVIDSKAWRDWKTYWLIDPLDGTKEFIKRNGEFTVNIALIHEHQSILGVVHIPVSDITYYASNEVGAYKFLGSDFESAEKISVNNNYAGKPRIVASRSHKSKELESFLKKLGEHEILSMGSSLKFCLIAEGKADCYPRFGLTSEWDTAAAQAIVEAAGGSVLKLDGSPLLYNTKDEILNPHFMVQIKDISIWLSLLP